VIEASTIEVEHTDGSGRDWDAFALRCDASTRGLHGWIKLWPIRSHILSRTVRYSIFHQQAGVRTKIGQCAVHIEQHRRVFADGLQLLPEYQGAWAACMRVVLSKLGPGRYVYGSYWSLEPPREKELPALAGITIIGVEKYINEGVDFSRWRSWEQYEQSISSNIHRNIGKARQKHGKTILDIRWGFDALALTPHLVYCRIKMLRRKSAPTDVVRTLANHALRSFFIPEYAFSAILRTSERVLATFGGAEVGQKVYYFDGGTVEPDGTGWLLKMSLMKNFYSRHPDGRFMMGYAHQCDNQEHSWESPCRYRRDARVSGFPTSMVTFTFTGASALSHKAGSRWVV
jgi:hypothetical protein